MANACPFSTQPLSQPMLTYWQLEPWEVRTNISKIWIRKEKFFSKKMYLKMSSAKWRPFCSDLKVLTVTQSSNDTAIKFLTLLVLGIAGEQGQYHDCWCPGSLYHQDISSHNIDNIGETCPFLPPGSISSTFAISVLRNDDLSSWENVNIFCFWK